VLNYALVVIFGLCFSDVSLAQSKMPVTNNRSIQDSSKKVNYGSNGVNRISPTNRGTYFSNNERNSGNNSRLSSTNNFSSRQSGYNNMNRNNANYSSRNNGSYRGRGASGSWDNSNSFFGTIDPALIAAGY